MDYLRSLFLVFCLSLAGNICLTQPALAYSVQNGTIIDAANMPIQLHGVNWFGFETQNYVVHGIWSRNYKKMIKQMKKIGVNAVRLPVCPDTLHGVPVSSIDYSKNSDLVGLNSIQVLDKIVAEFDKKNIYILLDHHRPDCSAISELWYTSTYSEDQWINDLVFMAKRYASTQHFIGIDIKNEPHGTVTWGTGNSLTDWNLAVDKAGQAILAANPNLLIFIEGIQENSNCSGTVNHWWGGNLEPIKCTPLNIPKSHLVLSPHVYGPDVYFQPYFSAADFPNNMLKIWNKHFGFAKKKGYALAIGEFGGKYGNGGNPLDVPWQDAFVTYLLNKNIHNTFYWSWNPNSGDTGGILQDDWKTLQPNKVELLKRLWLTI